MIELTPLVGVDGGERTTPAKCCSACPPKVPRVPSACGSAAAAAAGLNGARKIMRGCPVTEPLGVTATPKHPRETRRPVAAALMVAAAAAVAAAPSSLPAAASWSEIVSMMRSSIRSASRAAAMSIVRAVGTSCLIGTPTHQRPPERSSSRSKFATAIL